MEYPALTVAESEATVTVTVALSSAAMRDVVVNVATADGTAQGNSTPFPFLPTLPFHMCVQILKTTLLST